MTTPISRPCEDALIKATNIYRDAMRAFIVRHLRRVRGKRAESLIAESLNDNSRSNFGQRIRAGESVEGAIDFNDMPHIVRHNWRVVFNLTFNYDRAALNLMYVIVDARNRTAHPSTRDLPQEYAESRLTDIAELLGRTNEPDNKRRVESIRAGLRTNLAPDRGSTLINPKPPAGKISGNVQTRGTVSVPKSGVDIQSKGGYWLNLDSAGVRLHKDICDSPKKFAGGRPDKWKWFKTKEDALASTGRKVQPCRMCNP